MADDKELSPAQKMAAIMLSGEVCRFYRAGDMGFIDIMPLLEAHGAEKTREDFAAYGRLMKTEGKQLVNWMMGFAASHSDIGPISNHAAKEICTQLHAKCMRVGASLNLNRRCAWEEDKLWGTLLYNLGDPMGSVVRMASEGVTINTPSVPVFLPLPAGCRSELPILEGATAKGFPELLSKALPAFNTPAVIAATCGTLLVPGFVHPIVVFTGNQSRGKTGTMRFLISLLDPSQDADLLSPLEDDKDLYAVSNQRHIVGFDNLGGMSRKSSDALSRLFSGVALGGRELYTNSDAIFTAPKARFLLNGIDPGIGASDLISRCLFMDHPDATGGTGQYAAMTDVQEDWATHMAKLRGELFLAVQEALASMGAARADGRRLTSPVRMTEYWWLGEFMARAMGFPDGQFQQELQDLIEGGERKAIEQNEIIPLLVAYCEGKRAGADLSFIDADEQKIAEDDFEWREVLTKDFFKGIRALAMERGISTHKNPWAESAVYFGRKLNESAHTLRSAGWEIEKPSDHNRHSYQYRRIRKPSQ